ncbi:MAG: hypothetical protein RLY86_1176 [Pseudomonadota bacterium]|jgi:antitoxin (DNA-binding transcriptional repressor) of toxin-antitoxin stability system
MPGIIDLDTVQVDLDDLMERVSHGEELVLLRAGRPVMRVTPPGPAEQPEGPTARRDLPFGIWKDKGWVLDSFDDPLPDDILDAFEEWPKGPMREEA